MQKRASRKPPGEASDKRVSREDWVRCGLSVLAEDGIDAVRVEPLAERLGVTKGSFYWHFADRAALHTGLLQAWRQRATHDIVARVGEDAAGAREQLHRLIALTTASRSGARIETAIRSWASVDEKVARLVAEVDRERMAFVVGLMEKIGIGRPAAVLRTRMVYLMLIGSFFTASRGQPLATQELWSEAERLLISGAD